MVKFAIHRVLKGHGKRKRLLLSIISGLLSFLLALNVFSKDTKKGTLPRIEGFPPFPSLSEKEIEVLKRGEVVFRKGVKSKSKVSYKGFGIAVSDVHASPDDIWKCILDFPSYKSFMPRVKGVVPYRYESHGDMRLIFCRFELKILGVKIVYHIKHRFYPKRNLLIWELDLEKENDIADTVGFWILKEIKGEKVTRMVYSIRLDTGRWVPAFIEDILANKELPNVVKRMKARVEQGCR